MAKQKLMVNCANCDVRNITRNLLESYEEINVNAASVLSSVEANELMAGYPVTLNAASVICAPKDVAVMNINGKKKIGATEIDRPTFLIVNGKTVIEKDAEKSLKNIVRMIVNGKLCYPSNLEGMLPEMKVNGKISCYPGDAILLKDSVVIDKVFLLRVKPEKYYAEKRIFMLDKDLDLSKVKEETCFITEKAYITESLLEKAVGYFDDEVEIEAVPDGTCYVDETIRINREAICRYGKKLLVFGDVIVESNDAEAFEEIEYLNVDGRVLVADVLLEKLNEKNCVFEECQVINGALLFEKENVLVDECFVSKYEEGVTLVDCDTIEFAENVLPDWIEQHVKLCECYGITCSKEQKLVIDAVSEEVYGISIRGEETDQDSSEQEEGWKQVNTAEYVF